MTATLKAVDLAPSQGAKNSGLVPIRGRRGSLSIAEEASIREAEGIEGLDYVFFRRFGDGRSSQVAAYVINNEDDHLSEAKLALIHKDVWINGNAPLLYVGWTTRVDVLSCARGPDFWKQSNDTFRYAPAEKIEIEEPQLAFLVSTSSQVSELLEKQRRFSALRLADGTFWEDPRNAKLARSDQAAHKRLIEAVVEADEAVDGKRNPVLRRLLLLTILIKYLEDRQVFPNPGWFGRFHKGATSFFDVLSKGTLDEVISLLQLLEKKFNGDVFSLPDNSTQKLTTKNLRNFAELVESKTLARQRYLWEQYSFRHLPVEVLSHLYQRFAQSGKGAIYTPPFVASLLLDYAMPYESLAGKERVLDPTCGSGVFLVGAFRRLINHWRSRNKWKQPKVATLKTILRNSIFGVELQSEALHLAAFNLALAVCDALKPNVIWNELKFDKLHNTNLHECDFFAYGENQAARFDIVVGNPPFLSKLTEAGIRVNKAAQKVRGALPDQQAAYLVAEQALGLLSPGGRMCLIQPSSILYNEKARSFQRHLVSSHQIDRVLDFTSVRGLFDKADTKIAALALTKVTPKNNHRIIHLTFRRTVSVEEQLGFELDHYDRHVVTQQLAMSAPFTWKVNLLGGGRLHQLAARLKEMSTLAEFVAGKNWDYGEGYIEAETGKREKASWLKNKPLLPSIALTENGINEDLITKVPTEYFRSAYTPNRYSPPLIVIRENEKLYCDFWEKSFLAFKAKVVGIHAPIAEINSLRHFFQQFDQARPVLQAFCQMESTQMLIGRATAPLKRDIDNLPWPGPDETWDLSPWENILCNDVVDYVAEYVRLGQDSKLLKQAATADDLQKYAETFCNMLRSIHPSLRTGRSNSFGGLTYQSFYFGKQSDLDWPDDWSEELHKLVYVRHGEALRTVRILRLYESNTVLIVKPDRLRYWIRSTAIRDADETLVDLRKQGF